MINGDFLKKNQHRIKVLKYGLRIDGGKLERCFYSDSPLINFPEGTITVYAKDYNGFSKLVHDLFDVQNNTDMQVDYFEKDKFRVLPNHPMYSIFKNRVPWRT